MGLYDESKFNMWRACIGVIWIDGKITSDERDWIEQKIENLPFTSDQKEILKKDLETNINFEEVFSKISKPADRAFLVHQIRVISHMDNEFSPEEQVMLKKWADVAMGKVDMAEVQSALDRFGDYTPTDRHDAFEHFASDLKMA